VITLQRVIQIELPNK